MIYTVLIILGLCVGSFINALVWRIHEQEKSRSNKNKSELSILKGRSMCPHCRHSLSWKDLIPVFSWLSLRGKCRYCKKPISWQYPFVELITAVTFILSYIYWPFGWDRVGTVNFITWLVILAGLIALVIYDIHWMILPNRITYPLIVLAASLTLFNFIYLDDFNNLIQIILSVIIAGGLFYGIFIISNGKWIGGGDVKLGLLFGLLLADPMKAFLMLFGASILGTLFILPGLITKKISPKSRIPFGPFLIIAGALLYLFGTLLIEKYTDLLYTGLY